VSGFVQLNVGSSLGSLTKDDEKIWRKPLFESPPLCICHQEEETEECEEVREVQEEVGEDTSEGETKVNNTLQGVSLVSTIASSSESRRQSVR
jgi:hypothetical protein